MSTVIPHVDWVRSGRRRVKFAARRLQDLTRGGLKAEVFKQEI